MPQRVVLASECKFQGMVVIARVVLASEYKFQWMIVIADNMYYIHWLLERGGGHPFLTRAATNFTPIRVRPNVRFITK